MNLSRLKFIFLNYYSLFLFKRNKLIKINNKSFYLTNLLKNKKKIIKNFKLKNYKKKIINKNNILFDNSIIFKINYFNFFSFLISIIKVKKKFLIYLNYKKINRFKKKILKKKITKNKFYFCYLKLSKNNLFCTLTDNKGKVIFAYSGRTKLDIKLNTKIANAVYFTVPRFALKVRYEIQPKKSIEIFFLSEEVFHESISVLNSFKKRRIKIIEFSN